MMLSSKGCRKLSTTSEMISFAEENDSDFVPRIHDVFSEGGLLSRAKNFEFREEPTPSTSRNSS